MSVNTFTLTIFRDVHATVKNEITVDLAELAQRICQKSAPTKEGLPLGSFAKFGDKQTIKGSLRHDGNAEAFYGIWVEHDAGTMSFEEAHRRVAEARIAAVLYTTPSHRPEAPRWRAGFPFAGYMTQAQGYRNMVDRANALLGGVLSGESWTVSQSYYLGHIEGADHFRCEVTEGDFINVRRDLGAQGKAPGNGHALEGDRHRTDGMGGHPTEFWRAIAAGLSEGEGRREALKALTGLLLGDTMIEPHLAAALVRSFNKTHCHPPYDKANIEAIIQWAACKEARK